jgi:DNA-binding Xre family transcriptional regulator
MFDMKTPTRETTALNKAVAAQIRSLLGIRMMRQVELANRMGVTEVWLSRRLREVQPMSLDDVERIAQALEVTPVDLLPRGANLSTGSNLTKSHHSVRPRDTRPKGRDGTVLANRRTSQKRALTPEELAIIAA